VITEGDIGDAYYILTVGQLSVTRQGQPTSRPLTPGDGFGEIALLYDRPRTATVTPLGSCRLLRVQRDDFLAAVTRNTEGHRAAREVADTHLARKAVPHQPAPPQLNNSAAPEAEADRRRSDSSQDPDPTG
jgi:CRP-like cAMP-binding protein